MTHDLPRHIDKTTFLTWVQTRERKRFELVNGIVVEAEPHTLGHALAAQNLANALDSALERDGWHTLLSFGLDTGPNTIRDPDVLVDRGGRGKDVLANAPVLVAEVLSPGSATIDLGDKPNEYLKLPSVRAYLVLSQDEPKVWAWIRSEAGQATTIEMIAGEDGVIAIRSLGVDLSLAKIYAHMCAPS